MRKIKELKVLPKRLAGFIECAKVVPYSNEEIFLLSEILLEAVMYSTKFGSEFFTMRESLEEFLDSGYIIDTLNDAHLENDEFFDTKNYHLNLMQYLLINFKKEFLFLTQVPLERVPLYINSTRLAPFARWRLNISK